MRATAVFNNLQNEYYQLKFGTIEPGLHEARINVIRNVLSPGNFEREFWQQWRGSFAPDFRASIDEIYEDDA